jgi:hypothetical protein
VGVINSLQMVSVGLRQSGGALEPGIDKVKSKLPSIRRFDPSSEMINKAGLSVLDHLLKLKCFG